MRAIARRLQRLEQQMGPAVESPEASKLWARIEEARQRGGMPPLSRNQRDAGGNGWRDATFVDILNAGRTRAAAAKKEADKTAQNGGPLTPQGGPSPNHPLSCGRCAVDRPNRSGQRRAGGFSH
jgi:hypothetical protein